MEGAINIDGKEDQRDYDIYMLRQKMAQLEVFLPQIIKLFEDHKKDLVALQGKFNEIETKIREIEVKVR